MKQNNMKRWPSLITRTFLLCLLFLSNVCVAEAAPFDKFITILAANYDAIRRKKEKERKEIENKHCQRKSVPIYTNVYTNSNQRKKIIYLKSKTFLQIISLTSILCQTLTEECILMHFLFPANIYYTKSK